ncbi:DUF262 domain-containing protein [Haloferula sp. BvORR071]|uniref:DUF262 domain-containing protein n=1 Tax=Haloferula sp. BvORR071 TaxID=1396141 RepID=UPI0005513CBF|nr:DUF262 domain-containing protein [Haloferula sp. BvORR071]
MPIEESPAAPTFESIFLGDGGPRLIRIPDYQRAFTWEKKQIDLFVGDLAKFRPRPDDYYYGHFIIEAEKGTWELVDGQQRITTFILFLMVCRHLAPATGHRALGLIERFATVNYDRRALELIQNNLGALFELGATLSGKDEHADKEICEACRLDQREFTRSQKRIVLALARFHEAFASATLDRAEIAAYIDVVTRSNCSYHPAKSKAVAVSVFEMHNTRGVGLTTIEIVKAKLTRFVYDHLEGDRDAAVAEIQAHFGEIYQMEELLEQSSFRGDLTLEQLLRLHLRVIDDGTKNGEKMFESPAVNASVDDLIEYLEKRLHFVDLDKKQPRSKASGVEYARAVAREFKQSVRLASSFLPAWDDGERLVGDVLILERELSCQFFLLMARRIAPEAGESFGKLGRQVLVLWERLLFTRDFHDKYYRLSYRDNFPGLFEELCREGADPATVLMSYVKDGFRGGDVTKDLQKVVLDYATTYKPHVLNNAFYWWREKMIYVIYKFEIRAGAKVRQTMKRVISVEHILPQEWDWKWIDGYGGDAGEPGEELKEKLLKEIGAFINGIGNLLLLTRGENSSVGNLHPAKKTYSERYDGGTYTAHLESREKWLQSSQWQPLILQRGTEIWDFMVREMIGIPMESPDTASSGN